MSTENLQMTITAVDHASAVVDRLMSKMRQLSSLTSKISVNPTKGMGSLDTGKSVRDSFSKSQSEAMRGLRQRFTFESRMTRQRIADERAVAAEQNRTSRQQAQAQDRQEKARRVGESNTMAEFRKRMAFTNAMMRQQAQQARDFERDRSRSHAAAEREQAAAIRRQIGLDRYRIGLRERSERQEAANERRAAKDADGDLRRQDRARQQGRRDVRSGLGHARDAGGHVMDSARTVTVYGGIAGGIVGKIAQTGLSARSRADTAEANLRMFGGQTRQQVNDARSGWINGAAVANGFRPADAINAFTEALKAGIPASAAPDVTRSIMGASAGLDLDVVNTTKLVGRLSTLTQDPKAFSAGAIDKMLNAIAVTAKVTAADSRELVSSLRRGAGVLGSSKMSVGDLTAFTGTAISAGMQEGKAGTFMDFQVNELVNAKNARGQRRADLAKGLQLAGMPGLETTSRQMAQNPTEYLQKLYGNIAKMGPERAGQVANLIGMREWRSEILMMVKAFGTLRQAVAANRDPANDGHLAQARTERLGTLAGLFSQLRATVDLAFEAIGAGLEDIVRETGVYFHDLGSSFDYNVIKSHVASLVNGLVDGLGFKNVTEMLDRVFGKPDYSTVNSFFRFAQGFGQGIREVVDTIRSAFKMFRGQDATAEIIGNMSAKVIALGAALAFASPFVGVMTSIGAAIIGLAMAFRSIAPILRSMGLIGGAGAAAGAGAGAAAGAAGAVAGGGLLSRLFGSFKFGLPAIVAGSTSLKKGEQDGLVNRLGKWSKDRERTGQDGQTEAPARVEKQSFTTDSPLAGLIQRASLTGYDDRSDAIERLTDSVRNMGAKFQLAALSGPALASSAFSGGGGGDVGGSGSTVASRFFTPEGMTVPSWYGKGSGGGDASGGPAKYGMAGATFGAKAPGVMKNLITDFALTKEQAAGIVGNLGHESAGFTAYQEGNPRGGGRGGAGWAQWTGPRRCQFEAWSQAKGLDPRSDEANYGFLKHELNTTQAGALAAVRKQSSVGGSMVAFENQFERAGVKSWGSRMRYAQQAMNSNPNAATLATPGTSGLMPNLDGLRVKGFQAGAVDIASTMLGKDERTHRGELSKFVGHDVAGNLNAWCARFVNSSLEKAGVKGSGSALANSFLRWGKGVDAAAVQKGDVAVEHRNRGIDGQGGHVGLATGRTQRNAKGELEVETISGNHGDAVARDWTAASKLAIRRSGDAAANAAVASVKDVVASANAAHDTTAGQGVVGGWKPGAGNNAKALSEGVPAKSSVEDSIRRVPAGQSGMGQRAGGGGAGATYHIQQHINGGSNSPTEIANLAQKKITEDWNHRAHDLEPELV